MNARTWLLWIESKEPWVDSKISLLGGLLWLVATSEKPLLISFHLISVTCTLEPDFYGQRGVARSAARGQQHERESVAPSTVCPTHLIDFFSSKLIGSSRMAWNRSCVDMATSSLTRLCSSVTNEVRNNDLPVDHTSRKKRWNFLTVLHLLLEGVLCGSQGGRLGTRKQAHPSHRMSSPSHARVSWSNRTCILFKTQRTEEKCSMLN